MKRQRCTIVLLLASLVGAAAWTPTACAQDAPLTTEEKEELAAKRKEEWHDKQIKGLGACVLAAIFASVLFWALNIYNKAKKQKVLLERKDAVPEESIPIPYSHSPEPLPLPSEPPAGDW